LLPVTFAGYTSGFPGNAAWAESSSPFFLLDRR
jgi:hypothetical protein